MRLRRRQGVVCGRSAGMSAALRVTGYFLALPKTTLSFFGTFSGEVHMYRMFAGYLVLTIVFAIGQSSTALSQDTTGTMQSSQTDAEGASVLNSSSTKKWDQVLSDASEEQVNNILREEGWAQQDISTALSESDNYSLYKESILPGVSNYIALSGNNKRLTQFNAEIPYFNVKGSQTFQNASLMEMPSKEEIRMQIVTGIKSAIDGLCEIGTPDRVKVQANAFGFIKVDVTYSGSNICKLEN